MSISAGDSALFEQWVSKSDAHAFAALVDRHLGMVYGVCQRILQNPSDAEDVAQECFTELSQTRRSVKHSLAGWLHALAVARSLDKIRSEKRRRTREARYVSGAATTAETDQADVWAEIDEAITSLPDRLRAPIIARFLEGQTQEDVAQSLGTSRSTVQRRLDQGIGRIRAFLKHRGVMSSSAALVAVLSTHTAEAAPPTLVSTLGKIALSGGAPGSATLKTLAVGGGLATGTKVAIGVAAVLAAVLVAFAAWWLQTDSAKLKADPLAAPATEMEASHASLPEAHLATAAASVPPKAPRETEAAAAASAAVPAPQTATLRGRVVDSRGVPVCNMKIVLKHEGSGTNKRAKTDESGAFEVPDLPPGTYSFLSFTYATNDWGTSWLTMPSNSSQKVTVKKGEVLNDVVVRFGVPVGQTTLCVRVEDGFGEPVKGAQLTISTGGVTQSGPATDAEGRYRRHHAAEWESAAKVTVTHPDFETAEFAVPVTEEESVLVLETKEGRPFRVTVVDGKTGELLPDAELALDIRGWKPTQGGSLVFEDLSLAGHRISARATGYQSVLLGVNNAQEEPAEALIELFRPAAVRVEFVVEPSFPPAILATHDPYIIVREKGDGRTAAAKSLWHDDRSLTRAVSAGQPCDFVIKAQAKTHMEDSPATRREITVSGLVVEEGKEAKLRCSVGKGTCVLRLPKLEGLRKIRLHRDGDWPGITVTGALTHTGVSEDRTVIANKEFRFVAGELYPGTYRLSYELRGPEGSTSHEQFITFSKQGEEIQLAWD